MWKRARDNAEESELDEYACYCIPMPLFCDAEEAMDEALPAHKQSGYAERMFEQADMRRKEQREDALLRSAK